MKKFWKEKNFCNIIHFFCVLMFIVLFHYCLSLTGENKGPAGDEHIYFKRDLVLMNGVWIVLSLFILYLVGKISEKLTLKSRNIILGCACILSGMISLYWVMASKVEPIADQGLICQYADAFNMGDFNGLLTGRYVARYPQQLGMVTLLRGLFKIFGSTQYKSFQYMNALLVPLLVLSGCKIVRLLSDNNARTEFYYLIFSLCCFPMYAYTTFVYGDLISIITGMFGVWMYLDCLRRFTWWKALIFGLSMGITICLRMNFLILVIALVIVMLIKLCFDRSRKHLIVLAALLLGCGVTQLALWGMYRQVRTEDAPAIPSILFIVMGLNDDYQYAGWHNQYEYVIFAEANDNVALAKERGYEDLRMYMEIFKNDPDYMVDFFVRKMNSQWNAPMYQSIAMNESVGGEQLPVVRELFARGRLAEMLALWMKIFQLLMYGGILFLLLYRRDKFMPMEWYLLLIAVFGGFLFSLMWEAKTRYILPYLFMQIPYMAMGINEIITVMEQKIERKKG
ncbi:MAG: hypothetical protein HFH82_02355 [Lachnospiraceae bacterium]|nr:hypothetical protein [Lachnospiraceae bacterium]